MSCNVVCIMNNYFIRSQDIYCPAEDTTCSDEEEKKTVDIR